MKRRNFIKTAGRSIAFAGLAGMTTYLAFRDAPAEGAECNFDFACNNCKQLGSCTLPEAQHHQKDNETHKNNK